jgi:sulfur-oxidizing protein SoxY
VAAITGEDELDESRRRFTGHAALLGALAAAGWLPAVARAEDWNARAFEAKTLDELVKVLGGTEATESGDILIVAPEIAENGAVVPVQVVSGVEHTESLALLIEKNPNVVAALYDIPEGTVPDIQTRVKMAQTSNVFALVRSRGRMLYAAREIKITLGGCGG